jgi:hypothetical protein
VISGIVEKVYRARARVIRVAEGLLSISGASTDENTDLMLTDVFDRAHGKLRKGIAENGLTTDPAAPPQKRFFAARGSKRLTPEHAFEYFSRLEALTDEFFSSRESLPSQGDWYDLVTAMYPAKAGSGK